MITTALGLIVINLVLSGDNAVVIGMAAHKLQGKQRTLAIIFGGVAAIVLRVIFTALAAILLQVPALQFVGGAMLVWIAFKLLNEESGEEEGKTANSLMQAIWIITAADIIMSLDNILAVAAVSRGDMTTLIIGLAMSMPLVLFCGGIVAELMNRFPWLNYIGAIVIAWTAGEMMLQDKFIDGFIPAHILEAPVVEYGIPLVLAVGVPVIATMMMRRAKAKEVAEGAHAVAATNPEA
jgi:YjbE family integral membrane protein